MSGPLKHADQKFRAFNLTDADGSLIATLPANHREILSATGSYADIGAALNLAPGTVRSRLNRARAALVAARGTSMGAV